MACDKISRVNSSAYTNYCCISLQYPKQCSSCNQIIRSERIKELEEMRIEVGKKCLLSWTPDIPKEDLNAVLFVSYHREFFVYKGIVYCKETKVQSKRTSQFLESILKTKKDFRHQKFAILKMAASISIGKTLDEFISNLEECIEEYNIKRENSQGGIQSKEWQKLRERFDGNVIGMQPRIDISPENLTIRVALRSGAIEDHISFVKKNRKDLINYVIEEIKENKQFINSPYKKGKFYLDGIYVVMGAEVEFNFSRKVA